MQSTITERGQTVIPAAIRRQFHLSPSDKLEWVTDQDGVVFQRAGSNPGICQGQRELRLQLCVTQRQQGGDV